MNGRDAELLADLGQGLGKKAIEFAPRPTPLLP
jgi:hypothetical protein